MMLLCVMLSIMVLVPSLVYADGKDDARIEESASERIEPTASIRGIYLSHGTSEITKLSSNELHVMGITACARTSEKLYLYLSLERKVNGNYGTYKTWKFTKENATLLAKGIDVKVPTGYYYRVRGYHAAEANGTKESVSTLTDGILID